jgi:hypothetical protein
MHIKIFHLAAIDLVANGRIGVVWQTELDAVHFRKCTVELGSSGRPGPRAHAKLMAGRMFCRDARGERDREGLRIASAGETAHSYGTAGRNLT